MSARKTLPIGIILMILMMALAALGVGYAWWTEQLTATGTIQTTADQTLTLGGGNTGNIVITPLTTTTLNNSTVFSALAGTAGIAHISSTGLLSNSLVSLTTDVSGILPIANGGSPFNSNK